MAEPSLLSELRDGVLVLTLNRPERNNAWTTEMEERYFGALDQATSDGQVRAIVVTGAGKSFCPGLDSHTLSDAAAGRTQTNPELRRPQTVPTTVPKPIIAAINGACAGIGLIQAMMCDVRFAAAGARFSTAFARRGIHAEHGTAWLLPRLVGLGNAMDLMLSARVFGADEALRLGLVNRVTGPGEVVGAAVDYARDLAQNCSPLAMAITKLQIRQAMDQDLEASRTEALRLWGQVLKPHPDFKEGVGSFVERRPPSFAPLDPALVSSSGLLEKRREGDQTA
jgi:enoyl-CoA hydratase/carnithine racemase